MGSYHRTVGVRTVVGVSRRSWRHDRRGEILTYTTIAVPASDFIGESPTVVIIDAGSVRVTARWDHDAPPEVGQEAALWLGEEPSLHLRAHPVR